MCANILGAVWIEELKNAPVGGGGWGTKKIWAWSCLPFSRFQPALRIGVPQVEANILLYVSMYEEKLWLARFAWETGWLVSMWEVGVAVPNILLTYDGPTPLTAPPHLVCSRRSSGEWVIRGT